jgi:outer membrane biosynthesis protein TonB
MKSRYNRERGRVIVAVVIDEQGNVEKAKPVCGGPTSLREPALTSARGAKFSITIIDGKPTQVIGIITYNFVYP